MAQLDKKGVKNSRLLFFGNSKSHKILKALIYCNTIMKRCGGVLW